MKTRAFLLATISSLALTAGCEGVEYSRPKSMDEAWAEANAKNAAQIQAQNAVYAAQNDVEVLRGYEVAANDLEKKLVRSCQATLGQVASEGTDGKHIGKASDRFAELRRANIKIVIERVPSKHGGPPLYELRDDVMMNPEAARKLTETKSPALMREFQRRQPYTYKLMDLSTQAREASLAAFMANGRLAAMDGETAPILARQIAAMKAQGKSLDAQGRAQLRRQMAVFKKFQILAAASTGAYAGYEAAAAGQDPKVIDAVAEATLKVLPLKAPAEVTDAELDAMLEKVPAQLEAERKKYDEMMKKVFAYAPPATATPVIDGSKQAKVAPPSSSANTNDRASMLSSGLDLAGLPKDGVVRNSLEGVDALMRGDYKSALIAAAGLVPVGGGLLKDGLSFALSLIKG